MRLSEQGEQPLLRWAGSKRQLVPLLASFWNESFERYVEPFMGSACLFFHLSPPKALLSDLNSELVRMYGVVKHKPIDLAKAVRKLARSKSVYYSLREQNPSDLPKTQAAARFIYLNRFCFNGLFRTNLQGHFNVPYAPAKSGALPSQEYLVRISRVLRSARICCGDFEEILDQVRSKDFVYLDPPFAVSNRRVFRQYGPQTFGISDLQRLAKTLDRIDGKGATFVLSYAYCNEARSAFAKWPYRRVLVQRNIAGFAKCRRRAAEMLVSNALPT